MERATLKDLDMHSRGEVLRFLKMLWNNEPVLCPVCGNELELMHKKAKKSDCDWKCVQCDKAYKTLYLLDEVNEKMPF